MPLRLALPFAIAAERIVATRLVATSLQASPCLVGRSFRHAILSSRQAVGLRLHRDGLQLAVQHFRHRRPIGLKYRLVPEQLAEGEEVEWAGIVRLLWIDPQDPC